jgi:hypothetical protein
MSHVMIFVIAFLIVIFAMACILFFSTRKENKVVIKTREQLKREADEEKMKREDALKAQERINELTLLQKQNRMDLEDNRGGNVHSRN